MRHNSITGQTPNAIDRTKSTSIQKQSQTFTAAESQKSTQRLL